MKKNNIRNLIYLLIFGLMPFVFFGCEGCGQSNENINPESRTTVVPREKITIGRIPSGNVLDISERMEPLIALIQKKLNVEVQVRFAADYKEFSKHMENQEYDLAFCAPFQYIQAHEKAGYDAILRPVRYRADTYVGIIITAQPNINSLEQLKGKRIAFVDPRSTSGYLFPLGLLAGIGINSKDIQAYFLKGHDNVVLNVLNRNYDAGACYKGAEITFGKDQVSALKIIGQTEEIYNEPIAISSKFRTERSELADKFISLMTSLKETPEGLAAISKLGDGLERYVSAKDSDYNTVRMYSSKLPPDIIKESGL